MSISKLESEVLDLPELFDATDMPRQAGKMESCNLKNQPMWSVVHLEYIPKVLYLKLLVNWLRNGDSKLDPKYQLVM
jgi:hypothetical protein